MPQFSIFQTVAHSLEADNDVRMPVVLVATDAGWQIGVLLAQPEQRLISMFLPGSPRIASGSISYARGEYVRKSTSRPSGQWSIMRSRGGFSAKVCAKLAELQAAGKLDDRPDQPSANTRDQASRIETTRYPYSLALSSASASRLGSKFAVVGELALGIVVVRLQRRAAEPSPPSV